MNVGHLGISGQLSGAGCDNWLSVLSMWRKQLGWPLPGAKRGSPAVTPSAGGFASRVVNSARDTGTQSLPWVGASPKKAVWASKRKGLYSELLCFFFTLAAPWAKFW